MANMYKYTAGATGAGITEHDSNFTAAQKIQVAESMRNSGARTAQIMDQPMGRVVKFVLGFLFSFIAAFASIENFQKFAHQNDGSQLFFGLLLLAPFVIYLIWSYSLTVQFFKWVSKKF